MRNIDDVTPSESSEHAGQTPLIDTHCHLDDPSFADDLDEVVAQSRLDGVTRWINVGFEPERWESTLAISRRISGMSHMLGVHPSSADQWNPSVERSLRKLSITSDAVAIGEIGLDFLYDSVPVSVQMDAFNAQLDLALELGLPAVIHMRNSDDEMLAFLHARNTLPPLLFHSYDGNAALTDYVISSSSHVGVGGLATRQKSERLREQLLRIPRDRMLLETDSPYLVPARQKTRRNTPSQVCTIASFLSTLLECNESTIARETTHNALAFFGKLNHA